MWMNEWDVRNAADQYSEDPFLGPATRTLMGLMIQVNKHSDGWPYWRAPLRAADKLMDLIQQAQKHDREAYQSPRTPMPTDDDLRKAYANLRRFRSTRAKQAGFSFVIYATSTVRGDPPVAAVAARVPDDDTPVPMIPLDKRERDLLAAGLAKLLTDPTWHSITDEVVALGVKVRHDKRA